MSILTLRQLEIFAQVVQHGSFRRCAKEIGVSAVSISEHIRALEQRLGQPLFERSAGGAVNLTPSGRQAHERVCNILTDINGLVRSMSGELLPQQAVVSYHPFLSRYLSAGVERFSDTHPEISVRTALSTESTLELITKVRKNQISLAFLLVANASEAPETELIAEESMSIFVANTHPLAYLGDVAVEDITSYPAVILTQTNPLRHLTDHVLATVGLDGVRPMLETDEYGLILTEVARGKGFVCMFTDNAIDARNQGLVPLPTRFVLPRVQVRCAVSRQVRQSPDLRVLRDEMVSAYRARGALPSP